MTQFRAKIFSKISVLSLVGAIAFGVVSSGRVEAAVPAFNPVTEVTFPSTTTSNPGNLRMFEYVPRSLIGSTALRPVVVVMHGCNQTAATFARESGWMELAELRKFYLVIPQQRGAETLTGNHPQRCFNWFNGPDQVRLGGEAQSIAEMVIKFEGRYPGRVDTTKRFVTGLSAGGAMAAVMLATYPDYFAGGAINAGIPYKCASVEADAAKCMGTLGAPALAAKTSLQWGNLARSGYATPAAPAAVWTGRKPLVAIFHGAGDRVVDPSRMTFLRQQWANFGELNESLSTSSALKTATQVDFVTRVAGSTSTAKVKTVSIPTMTHAVSVDQPPPNPIPSLAGQCGQINVTGTAQQTGICAAYYSALFWGI
jgi:poly(hydroxyalkanoate) depolymerase family esterase